MYFSCLLSAFVDSKTPQLLLSNTSPYLPCSLIGCLDYSFSLLRVAHCHFNSEVFSATIGRLL